jgi:hypothetical protein
LPVVVQAWDFGPGSHFVAEMQQATPSDTESLMTNRDQLQAPGSPEFPLSVSSCERPRAGRSGGTVRP